VEHQWRRVGALGNTSSEGRVRVGGATVWLWWPVVMERVPTGESRGRRMAAQNKKTPSGSGAHQTGGRGGGGSEFAEEPAGVVVFNGECGLDFTRVERGVSHAVKRERKGGGGVKGATAVLGGLYAGAERRREKSGGPSSMCVQMEEKREGGSGAAVDWLAATREWWSQAGGGAGTSHGRVPTYRGDGGGNLVGPRHSPKGRDSNGFEPDSNFK
jgi:hypothetical protein